LKTNEYKKRGDYHKSLSREWSYYPIYVSKKKFVIDFISGFPKDISILDVGCGEGVFVEELLKMGYQKVIGLDENYSSLRVLQGNAVSLPFKNDQFDVVLFLDVLEHIPIEKQTDAVKEIYRVLKQGGILVASIPNLAHLASRIKFLFKGRLGRTASTDKHPGDRPIKEFLDMFMKNGFFLLGREGFFPTVPVLYKLIQRRSSRYLWLYHLLNLFLPVPGWCFLNLTIYKKAVYKLSEMSCSVHAIQHKGKYEK
jgi:ubiquinone/menaquinone biosynthesis C-methylase UbiE